MTEVRPYQSEDKATLLALSLRSWEPVFSALESEVSSFVYECFYPRGWRIRGATSSTATGMQRYSWGVSPAPLMGCETPYGKNSAVEPIDGWQFINGSVESDETGPLADPDLVAKRFKVGVIEDGPADRKAIEKTRRALVMNTIGEQGGGLFAPNDAFNIHPGELEKIN